MTASFRVGFHNVENMFTRYDFDGASSPVNFHIPNRTDWTLPDLKLRRSLSQEKKLTGALWRKANADFYGAAEVENLTTFKRFRDEELGGAAKYPHVMSVEGNDFRGINLAAGSRFPITHVRSWQHLMSQIRPGQPIFSRDCLELEITLPDGTVVPIFPNHFKSMGDRNDPCNGRKNTREIREEQAATVRKIITDKLGNKPGDHPFIIVADLNDYMATDAQGKSSLTELVNWDQLENVIERLPADEQWTHFFKGNKNCNYPAVYHQLDYLLISKWLAKKNPGNPFILRDGMPLRASKYQGPRLPGVGFNRPKASDHCLIGMDLTV